MPVLIRAETSEFTLVFFLLIFFFLLVSHGSYYLFVLKINL